jgi:hypothetical protein
MADKPATINLDGATVAKIESTLRNALGGASAANIANVPPSVPTTASVPLDPDTVAKFTEHLRSALANSSAANIADNAAKPAPDKPR